MHPQESRCASSGLDNIGCWGCFAAMSGGNVAWKGERVVLWDLSKNWLPRHTGYRSLGCIETRGRAFQCEKETEVVGVDF